MCGFCGYGALQPDTRAWSTVKCAGPPLYAVCSPLPAQFTVAGTNGSGLTAWRVCPTCVDAAKRSGRAALAPVQDLAVQAAIATCYPAKILLLAVVEDTAVFKEDPLLHEGRLQPAGAPQQLSNAPADSHSCNDALCNWQQQDARTNGAGLCGTARQTHGFGARYLSCCFTGPFSLVPDFPGWWPHGAQE